MKRSPSIAFGILAGALMVGLAPVPSALADGKALFVDNKCNTCHSIKNVGVEKAKKKKGPDLSGVGLEHDSAWITKWLKKEQEKKSLYGDRQVKHKKKWKGSEADLKTVADFLAAQKTKVEVKDEGGEEDSGGDE